VEKPDTSLAMGEKGRSFQMEGLATANACCWARSVLVGLKLRPEGLEGLKLRPELILDYPLDNPSDSSQCS